MLMSDGNGDLKNPVFCEECRYQYGMQKHMFRYQYEHYG